MSFAKKYPKTAKAIRWTGNALKVAHQAYNMARVVASIVNAERKYHDYTTGINPDTTAQLVQLTDIDQGDSKELRNGDSIAIKSLQIDYEIKFDADVPLEAVRVIIFRENDNGEGAIPTSSQLLESDAVKAFRNKDFPKKFKVLYDKYHSCDTSKLLVHRNYFKKFKMMKDRKGNPTRSAHITWSGVNGTDIGRGHLYLLVVGNQPTANTTSEFYLNSRVRFYDN